MLETAAERLSRRGGPHFGSPDKLPAVRLATIAAAGAAAVPFTSGILIGIGETRARAHRGAAGAARRCTSATATCRKSSSRISAPSPDTRMAQHAEPSLDEHLWTIAVARILFGAGDEHPGAAELCRPGRSRDLIAAGINDWGGVSPVTPDHVNPERPWPALDALARDTAAAGKVLVERLAVYPGYVAATGSLDRPDACARACCACPMRKASRAPTPGSPGADDRAAARCRAPSGRRRAGPARQPIIDRAVRGRRARAKPTSSRCSPRAAKSFRRGLRRGRRTARAKSCGERVSYVVNRNINYTNVCAFRCAFCAFSKGKSHENLRGRPYDLDARGNPAPRRGGLGARRDRGLPAGRHPSATTPARPISTICRAIKEAAPGHAHPRLLAARGLAGRGDARHDACRRSSAELKAAGLGILPGTAAEILDDEVRAIICPDKVTTAQWLDVDRGRASRRPAHHRDHHVRPCRCARAIGRATCCASARLQAAHRRVHRIRAAAVRADGSADAICAAAAASGRPSARRC